MMVFVLAGTAMADGSEPAPRFEDIRLGQKGDVVRVHIVCGGPCEAELLDRDRFFLAGVSGDLGLDPGARGGPIDFISLSDLGSASELALTATSPVRGADIADCGARAICIDLRFGEPTTLPAAPTVAAPGRDDRLARRPAKPVDATPVAVPAVPAADLPEIPSPKSVAETPVSAPFEAGWQASVAADLSALFDRQITPEGCAADQATLESDAWNIDAYRRVIACRAAAGDLDVARTELDRLEKYLPSDPSIPGLRQVISRPTAERGPRTRQLR